MSPVLDVQNLSVHLSGQQVLADVDLKLYEGQALAVIGPNGGGKTTLLRTLLGLLEPSAGQVQVLGRDPVKARGLVGYVPQHTSFDRDVPARVCDVVRLGQRQQWLARWLRSGPQSEAVNQALQRAGIAELHRRPLADLSGGQLQRVLIARALVIQPRLLLLDEPTASLDAQGAHGFYDLLDQLRQQSSVVIVSHDLHDLTGHVDQIALVNRHVQCAPAAAVTTDMIKKVFCCPMDLPTHLAQHPRAAPEPSPSA